MLVMMTMTIGMMFDCTINEHSLQEPFVLCCVVLKIADTEEDENADDDVEHDNDVDNDDDTDDAVENQPNTSHHVTRRGQGVLKPGGHLRYLQEM